MKVLRWAFLSTVLLSVGCGSFCGRVECIGITGHPSESWGLYPGTRFDVREAGNPKQETGIRVLLGFDIVPSTVCDTVLLPVDVWQKEESKP